MLFRSQQQSLPYFLVGTGDFAHRVAPTRLHSALQALQISDTGLAALQVAFQFKTYLQSGNTGTGLGTGHTSLEPSLLASLKLGPETYLQAQLGNWCPIGATNNKIGGIFFWYFSLNQVLTYVTPRSPLIATLEMDGWSFENGGWTNPYGWQKNQNIYSGGGVSYFNIGPGLRWSICDKVDFGGAVTFPTTVDHWAQPWMRFEVRFLF